MSSTPSTDAVLGVDGCPGGWIGVQLTGARVEVSAAQGIAELVGHFGAIAAIGVDIPVGLADHGHREADLLARAALGARRSSVFLAPVRAAVDADDYDTANALNRAHGAGGLTRQAFGLRDKILDVDRWDRGGLRLVEVHPELSFAHMRGEPLPTRKKTWAGAVERYRLLVEQGILIPGDLGPAGDQAGVDDVLDAAAAAWTARRVALGEAIRLPSDRDGDAPAIWY